MRNFGKVTGENITEVLRYSQVSIQDDVPPSTKAFMLTVIAGGATIVQETQHGL